jgi:T-complex protein 1 subunit eta
VLVAGELLKQAKQFVEEGMHSQIIIKGYREAMKLCVDRTREISVKIGDKTGE